MSGSTTGIPIDSLPVLGAVTDDSAFVGEHAGSGLFNATAVTTYVAASPVLRSAQNNVGRSLLHNPLFNVAQRGTSVFTTTGYTLDRWYLALSLDTTAVQQIVLTDAQRSQIGDEEANNCMIVNVTGNAGAASYTQVWQNIENVRRLAGKTCTVSFWAYVASGAGKIGVSATQVFGTGGSPSAAIGNNAGATPNLTSVPTRYSITFTYPSIVGKTLGTNNDHYSRIVFWFSSGATNNATAGGIGVQTANFILWGVQMEIGSTATPLEKPDPRYDLSNCQRFYQTGVAEAIGAGYAAGAYVGTMVGLPVTMRAQPTLTANFTVQTNATGSAVSAQGASGILMYTQSVASSTVILQGSFTASADL